MTSRDNRQQLINHDILKHRSTVSFYFLGSFGQEVHTRYNSFLDELSRPNHASVYFLAGRKALEHIIDALFRASKHDAANLKLDARVDKLKSIVNTSQGTSRASLLEGSISSMVSVGLFGNWAAHNKEGIRIESFQAVNMVLGFFQQIHEGLSTVMEELLAASRGADGEPTSTTEDTFSDSETYSSESFKTKPYKGYVCKFCFTEGGQPESHWHVNCPHRPEVQHRPQDKVQVNLPVSNVHSSLNSDNKRPMPLPGVPGGSPNADLWQNEAERSPPSFGEHALGRLIYETPVDIPTSEMVELSINGNALLDPRHELASPHFTMFSSFLDDYGEQAANANGIHLLPTRGPTNGSVYDGSVASSDKGPASSRRKLCFYYMNSASGCFHGDTCKYAHSLVEVIRNNPHFRMKLCPNIQNGEACSEARSCSFYHTVTEKKLADDLRARLGLVRQDFGLKNGDVQERLLR